MSKTDFQVSLLSQQSFFLKAYLRRRRYTLSVNVNDFVD